MARSSFLNIKSAFETLRFKFDLKVTKSVNPAQVTGNIIPESRCHDRECTSAIGWGKVCAGLTSIDCVLPRAAASHCTDSWIRRTTL